MTLESLISAFQEGAGAEQIAERYPMVPLGDVFQILGYYLHHTSEGDEYLANRRQASEVARADSERRWDPEGVRARLLARKRG